jgi:hypothetical protein
MNGPVLKEAWVIDCENWERGRPSTTACPSAPS